MADSPKYTPAAIEPKWRAHWEATGAHTAPDDPGDATTFYCLDMFPYPSGSGLHVGHWRGYVLSDVLARFRKLHGDVVLHPMGWDAFGLPAENDAIKKQSPPRINTQQNIDTLRRQLKEIGAMYDWSREVATTDPEYYRWTQWIFLKMFHRGLAVRGNVPINWCPSCLCGLADAEVVGGKCERCGTEVEPRDRTQWQMRITEYAQRLLDDLDGLDWPEKVKKMQSDWIGRSEGATVTFELEAGAGAADTGSHDLQIYTTRPDTLFGATYMVLAPEHPLAAATASAAQRDAVEAYAKQARQTKEMDRTAEGREKSGVATGAFAINPCNGARIPVWVSDYVLMGYGTGAIMSVPAHDDRDFAFATKFGLDIIEVIDAPPGSDVEANIERHADGSLAAAWTAEGVMKNSGEFDGTASGPGRWAVTDTLAAAGKGERTVNFKMRDWVFSRQRYWGEPIPIIHCADCGAVGVPESDLPVLLPEVENYQVSGTGDSPLVTIREWVETPCPKCGGPGERETDTMPQWAGSCWYFLRYPSPSYTDGPFDPEAVQRWLPVDQYVGGVEHAVLHLLYARFFVKVLYDEGLVPFTEPFKRLFNQGMIGKQTFRCDSCRKWWREEEVQGGTDCPACSAALEIAPVKMSKSKGNDVSPDALVQAHGADALRLYELFVGPPEVDAEWTTNGIEGCSRFLKRFWKWVHKHAPGADTESGDVERERHRLVQTITQRIDGLRFNTAISFFMEFLNAMEKSAGASAGTLQAAVVCLAPFAPHIAEELWSGPLAQSGSVFATSWPTFDEAKTTYDEVEIPVQVNGKHRATLTVSADSAGDKAGLEAAALADGKVQSHIAGKEIKKVIVVPKRLVNIVAK
jgi:leucyl-tRNA synthetase